MQRVIEVARILGVSKVTVYKKMELLKKELKPYIRYRSNIAYIEEPGVELLRQSLNISQQEDQQVKEEADSNTIFILKERLSNCQANLIQAYDQQYAELLQQVELMSHLIRMKKEENEKKEQQLKLLQRLVKWNKSSALFVEKVHARVIEKKL